MVKIQFALLLLEQFAISQGLIEPFLKKIKIVYVVHTCTLSCQLINMKMRFFFSIYPTIPFHHQQNEFPKNNFRSILSMI